ncbi:alpha/beta fold hydrolase [Streptomyces fumanus]|uniref:alpha/beta fold hydrolase n=1 Tax=Streptomyces fumanus TaxID=67302 RepID=UPI001E3D5388|nr:alpha/beta hydrolase [Streptomyces fumanus]
MTSTRVEVPGGHLRVQQDGVGEGAVVLLHAGVTDHRMWDGVAGVLGRAHRVVRYDLRGFGESSPATRPFRHVDDLFTVMDACGVKEAVLVGASYGGKVALEAAAVRPGRVRGLVLLAPPRPGHDWSGAMERYAEAEEAALGAGDLGAAVQVSMDMWVRGPDRAWDGRLREHAEAVRESMRVALAHQKHAEEYEEDLDPAVDEDLAKIDVPVVVGIGTSDVGDFQQIAEHLASTLPNAELVHFPDTGHLIALERPDETSDLISAFISRTPITARSSSPAPQV